MYIVYMMYIVYAMYAVYRSLPPVVGAWTGEPTPYPPIPLGGGGRDHGSRDHIYIYIYIIIVRYCKGRFSFSTTIVFGAKWASCAAMYRSGP